MNLLLDLSLCGTQALLWGETAGNIDNFKKSSQYFKKKLDFNGV